MPQHPGEDVPRSLELFGWGLHLRDQIAVLFAKFLEVVTSDQLKKPGQRLSFGGVHIGQLLRHLFQCLGSV